MTERVTTPYNPRGPHTTSHPPEPQPEPQPDPTLTNLATAAGLTPQPAAALAAAITRAGYRAPTPLTQWAQTLDYPPTTILTDRHGTPWSADAITEIEWEHRAPWAVIYTPPVPNITT